MAYIKKKDRQPAEGGAVTEPLNPVREPIKEMLAGGSEDDFKASLPEQTSTEADSSPEDAAPRRKRRSKAEIAAAKGEGIPAPVDKRLERAKQKCAGLGASGMVSAGFTMAGKPLDDQESEDVGDQFYLISAKVGASADSWLFIIVYTIALLAKLIMIRTELGEDVQKWLKELLQPKKEEKKNGENNKQAM